VPAEPREARRVAEARVAAFAPTHLVSVERPGRAADGGYYNARGRSITGLNAPLDGVFLRRWPGVVTVGVGDGGNEIGMGRVRARVARDVPNGARIASVVRTDHLIVAGTSNWGAWGLVAHLALVTGRRLLHTPAEEARLTRAMVRAGAVDGLTGAPVASVDNLPLGVHQSVLGALRELVGHLRAREGGGAASREKETA
jgi:hypothetical protein